MFLKIVMIALLACLIEAAPAPQPYAPLLPAHSYSSVLHYPYYAYKYPYYSSVLPLSYPYSSYKLYGYPGSLYPYYHY